MTGSVLDASNFELGVEAAQAIIEARHGDPFSVLGPHVVGDGVFARAFIPHADAVEAITLDGAPLGQLRRTHKEGLFEGALSLRARGPIAYIAMNAGGRWRVEDPYSYGPVLGPMDDYFMAEGSHQRLFDKLGSRLILHEGANGAQFAVWAPNAERVSVVGDFNGWDARRCPMRLRRGTGVWEIFIPGLGANESYKFDILGRGGPALPQKADPFAFHSEVRPKTASKVAAPLLHKWSDGAHRAHWAQADARREPISIYEVHAGSWRRHEDGSFLNWDQLAASLIPYAVDMGFTHIEFLPITEHPYDPSWGYQTTGLYAATSRFGDRDGFARFVEGAHKAGIGVILDWVPAHFPLDAHGLARFDGTALYEHEDPKEGYHPDWNTAIFNFGRREVAAFLINSALYWAEQFHVDGLRVDAVASMLYRDYSRKDGEWVPNVDGGRENYEAVQFLKEMNRAVYGSHKGVITCAEESTSWPKVSHPVHEGGLGFGFKWNMGFMHDTLQYMKRDPVHRRHHHNELTFGLLYAFTENFILPLSHDEVVHGKGSLLTKMSGDDWRKFANLRAYYAFMWGYPGKKLLFMGQEFAQRREWSESRGLDWDELQHAPHQGVQALMRDLNRVYRNERALHARDCEPEGFEWLVADDADHSVYAWVRRAPDTRPVAVISNFTPTPREGYFLPLPAAGRWQEILNTDAHIYGGEGFGNAGVVMATGEGRIGALISIPPLATLMLAYEPQ
jgi:1,4-alpha-glucan branching enzyme